MTVFLSPIGGAAAQFFDNNGTPLAGGNLYTYAAGTTTPQVTYTSLSANTAHTNPIILNSAGRVPGSSEIWLQSLPYKFILKTSTGVTISTSDNISGIGANELNESTTQNFVGDGVTVTFTLASAPYSENTMQVYINGVYQQRNSYSVSSVILTFSEAPPATSSIEVLYS